MKVAARSSHANMTHAARAVKTTEALDCGVSPSVHHGLALYQGTTRMKREPGWGFMLWSMLKRHQEALLCSQVEG